MVNILTKKDIRFSFAVSEELGNKFIEYSKKSGRSYNGTFTYFLESFLNENTPKAIEYTISKNHIIWAVFIPLFLFVTGRMNDNDPLLFSLGIASLGGFAAFFVYFRRSNNGK